MIAGDLPVGPASGVSHLCCSAASFGACRLIIRRPLLVESLVSAICGERCEQRE